MGAYLVKVVELEDQSHDHGQEEQVCVGGRELAVPF